MTTSTEAPGLYLYAIVRAPDSAPALGTGIRNTPLELVSAAGLAAVVHDGQVGPLAGDDADVKRWIVQHSEVVERAWALDGTVLPATFNVIVSPGEDASASERLRDWLTDSARTLAARLAALDGLVELRVEIALDQHAVAERNSEAAELRDSLSGRPPGVQRLLRKKLDTLERDAADRLANELYPDYRRRLAEHCVDVSENRRTHPRQGYVTVLDLALLAERGAVEAVGSSLAAVRSEQPAATVTFIGPWPPYSFTDAFDVDSAEFMS